MAQPIVIAHLQIVQLPHLIVGPRGLVGIRVLPAFQNIQGIYHISYDFLQRATEDDPPAGWGAYRANTYRAVIRHLNAAGFARNQYSDYSNPNAGPLHTYWTMVSLRFALPPTKMATTLKKIKISLVLDEPTWDQTDHLQLGGHFSDMLEGPTPQILAFSAILAIPPQPYLPGQPFNRPRHTRPSPAANNPANWRH
ncbi:hypothetical protein GYMLUDRAFT_61804 [Collybiopsis luxurians FD-317 M1]|uniref:Uncharacterized protein n=1 Tax=Collybiopsis luxurians FD-317 M1 TaxID=944289 RepID=A0A0D0CF95_9AGAR|nr:hypothetical protein GYMLUDRAFT_61804 [Collybiopsis luxurians FD-317 M1]